MTNSAANPVAASSLRIAVVAAHQEWVLKAAELAAKLNLPLAEENAPRNEFDLLLAAGPDGFQISATDKELGSGISIDFVHGATAHRRRTTSTGKQLLARAIGLRQGRPDVIDATAGLGRDSLQIAALGCRVRAVERSSILAWMLQDAIQRARESKDLELQKVVNRILVIHADTRTYLHALRDGEAPDVIYLDPMYTPRQASALSKKEMRILRLLVGGDEDAADLLQVARETAKRHVVVKRHLRAPPLAAGIDRSYPGRTVRYDVYTALPKGMPQPP